MFTALVDHLQRVAGKDKIKKVLYISQSSYRLESWYSSFINRKL